MYAAPFPLTVRGDELKRAHRLLSWRSETCLLQAVPRAVQGLGEDEKFVFALHLG